MKTSLLIVLLSLVAPCVFAATPLTDVQLLGSSNQVKSSATLTVKSGATFTAESGSTVDLSAATLTLASSGTGNIARVGSPTFTTQITVPKLVYSGSVLETYGSGTPEGAVSAAIGSVFHRTDGGSGTSLYIKESGTGNTGWAAVGGGGGSGTVTHTVGALTANQVIIGNGSADLQALGSAGTNHQVLHGNASGPPTFGAVDLANDVTGILPIANIATGTPTGSKFVRDDGTLATPSGSGTVNSGTANYIAYYPSTGTAVSGLATSASQVLVTDGSGIPGFSSSLPAFATSTITFGGGGTITGASGGVTIAASGTNQNIYIQPSGSGLVSLSKTANTVDAMLSIRNSNSGGTAQTKFDLFNDSGATSGTNGLSFFLTSSANGSPYTSVGGIWLYENSSLAFATNATEHMRLSAAGNLLIGTTSETGLTGGGGLKLNSTTASTSTTTGALVVGGGVGIAGVVNASTGSFTTLIVSSHTPSSSSDTGTAGTITWDSSYVYICTATNTWKRVAIATW